MLFWAGFFAAGLREVEDLRDNVRLPFALACRLTN